LKLKVISENYNPLMKRKEINIEISHEKTGTPDRISLRDSIINKFKSNKDNSYIIKLETNTGTNRSLCYAEIYDDFEYARNVVPRYIIERNFPSEKEVKEEKSKEEKKPEKPEPEKPVEITANGEQKEEKIQAEPVEEAKPEKEGNEEKLEEETKSEKTVQPSTEEKPKEGTE